MAAQTDDLAAPRWARTWACTIAEAEPASSTRVGSNDANAVYRLQFADRTLFLKVGPCLLPEYERLRWLEGRLPAPRPVAFTGQDGVDALLTSAVAGQSLAALCASLSPPDIVARIAAALRVLHEADTTGWPFGGSGRVLVHGDACLPNFLYVGELLSGYIDVGEMALGEPEVDLAAAVWSLQYNLGAGHGAAFLRAYGVTDADEEIVERLRVSYELR